MTWVSKVSSAYCYAGRFLWILKFVGDIAAEEKRLLQQLSKDDFDEDYLLQKISMLQLRLDEAKKTVQIERE